MLCAGWKVSDDVSSKDRLKRSLSSRGWGGARPDATNSLSEQRTCRLRYQQSNVEVYARFLAKDHDSGRVSYFVSRRTWLKVTELVMNLMRVADPRIASLRSRALQGRSTGRTEVQVLSPITGRVIGLREVRVVNDKVTISRLLVRVISGLQLNISPDTAIENGYVSETTNIPGALATAAASVDVDFSGGDSPQRPDTPQNDDIMARGGIRSGLADLGDVLKGLSPFKDENNHEPTVQAQHYNSIYRGNTLHPRHQQPPHMTPVEIGNIPHLQPRAHGASAALQIHLPREHSAPETPAAAAHDARQDRSVTYHTYNHEPTVQAQHYNSIYRGNTLHPRHQQPPHMTPVEIGNIPHLQPRAHGASAALQLHLPREHSAPETPAAAAHDARRDR
ncbi:Uncharacterized protein OBRU01_01022 [Operophtera brumata]|uniref:Transmembrane protein TMEM132 fifth domain-containing protein n=1 Tax=Operophtera brumata TaxID=104452 RepID=A0A0L7LU38_OPEBR|nr:Uncharacterized protein OBRU01_01022 [Operophtera brumata]